MGKSNPHVGAAQPDLFSADDTKQFVPLSSLSEKEILELPFEAFTESEFNSLTQAQRKRIAQGSYENVTVADFDDLEDVHQLPAPAIEVVILNTVKDPTLDAETIRILVEEDLAEPDEIIAHNEKVSDAVEKLTDELRDVVRHVTEPDEQYVIDEAQEDWANSYHDAEGMLDNFKRAQKDVYDELFEEFVEDLQFTEEVFEEELGTALTDVDNYPDWSPCDPNYDGTTAYGAYRPYSFYYPDNKLANELARKYGEAFVEAAIENDSEVKDVLDAVYVYGSSRSKPTSNAEKILSEEDGSIERELQYSDQFEHYACADADEDLLRTALENALDMDEGERRGKGWQTQIPTEETVVYRFKHPDFPKYYAVDLPPDALERETERMKHCVGQEAHGVPQSVRSGRAKLFSIRKPNDKPVFSIRVWMSPDGTFRKLDQVKGLLNRIPGYGTDGKPIKKLGEVDLAKNFIEDYLEMDPAESADMRPGLKAYAQRAEELERKRQERLARSQARRAERGNPEWQPYTGYEAYSDLTIDPGEKQTGSACPVGDCPHCPKPNPSHRYMSLSAIKRYEPDMRRRGVSEVARSPRGFLTAYKRAGTPARLSPAWRRKREAFIARHMAQVKSSGEKLMRDGKPSRRALALIAWAYKPPGVR